MKSSEILEAKAAIWHQQIAGLLSLAQELGQPQPDLAPYYAKLKDLFMVEGPLAALQDDADIVVRAEGPAVVNKPPLADVNWLFANVQTQFKGLVAAAFATKTADAMSLASKVPIVLTGIAPGSFYAGFKLDTSDDGFNAPLLGAESHEEAIQSARGALENLVVVPGFVLDTAIDEEIYEVIPDPAMRDASLMAAYHLSPTGQRGIHTLEFSSPNADAKSAELDTRDRVVLRETVVKKPVLRAAKRGKFVGVMRGVDLDKTRVMLRDVDGIGSLRCAIQMNTDMARALLGKRVLVSGMYEENRHGKPAMLNVEQIEPVPELDL